MEWMGYIDTIRYVTYDRRARRRIEKSKEKDTLTRSRACSRYLPHL